MKFVDFVLHFVDELLLLLHQSIHPGVMKTNHVNVVYDSYQHSFIIIKETNIIFSALFFVSFNLPLNSVSNIFLIASFVNKIKKNTHTHRKKNKYRTDRKIQARISSKKNKRTDLPFYKRL